MTWLQFVAVCLASSAVIDVWENGVIFRKHRTEAELAVKEDRASFFGRLVDCWYCFSHWVPAVVILFYVLPGFIFPSFAAVIFWPVYALAATRVVVLLDGLLPARMRFKSEEEKAGLPEGLPRARERVFADVLNQYVGDPEIWRIGTIGLNSDDEFALRRAWPKVIQLVRTCEAIHGRD